MSKTRLEAFSDAIIAIIMTIMVLELHVPHGADWQALRPVVPPLLTYLFSFVMLGIYWNNHHHLFHATQKVTGRVLWANIHLLFWLSLIPFATAWLSETHYSSGPAALYGVILLMAAVAWAILQQQIIKSQEGKRDVLKQAVGNDSKGKSSLLLYIAGIGSAFWQPRISLALYALTALIWLIPDRRIEKAVKAEGGN